MIVLQYALLAGNNYKTKTKLKMIYYIIIVPMRRSVSRGVRVSSKTMML